MMIGQRRPHLRWDEGKAVKRSAIIAVAALASLSALPAAGSTQISSVASGNIAPLPVLLAHLRIHMSTTADWTGLTLSQGQTVASRVRHRTGTGAWTVQTAGLSLNGAAKTGVKQITVDLLYLDTNDEPLHVTVTKSPLGYTHATIENLSTGRTVGRLTDTGRDSASGARNAVGRTFTKAQLMGAASAKLPRVDPRKLVLAFYYPWYTTYAQPQLAQRPAHPRSTYRQAGVSSMTRQAKANGVNGFIVSWAGAAKDGKQFGLALRAANRQHQVISGYLESVMAADGQLLGGEKRELQWLVQLLKYRHSPAFLKTRSGVPVVFVYTMNELNHFQWQDLLHKLHTKYHEKVALIGDDPNPSYLPYEYGVHAYGATASPSSLRTYAINTSLNLKGRAALYPGSSKKLLALPVSPGFDDQRLHGNQNPIVPRDGGKRYAATWRAALAGQPDWILVTSWNEWYEDTAIEPGAKTGAGALTITRRQAAAWKHAGS